MCAESQAGQRFCGMLTGSTASSSGVPVEHAVALACALRDHLAACSGAPAGAAEAPRQPKKRKQRGAAAAEQAQVCLCRSEHALRGRVSLYLQEDVDFSLVTIIKWHLAITRQQAGL